MASISNLVHTSHTDVINGRTVGKYGVRVTMMLGTLFSVLCVQRKERENIYIIDPYEMQFSMCHTRLSKRSKHPKCGETLFNDVIKLCQTQKNGMKIKRENWTTLNFLCVVAAFLFGDFFFFGSRQLIVVAVVVVFSHSWNKQIENAIEPFASAGV